MRTCSHPPILGSSEATWNEKLSATSLSLSKIPLLVSLKQETIELTACYRGYCIIPGMLSCLVCVLDWPCLAACATALQYIWSKHFCVGHSQKLFTLLHSEACQMMTVSRKYSEFLCDRSEFLYQALWGTYIVSLGPTNGSRGVKKQQLSRK